MRGRAWTASAMALGLLLCEGRAGADEPSAEDRARLPSLLRAGADATKANKWDACITALSEAAFALDRDPSRPAIALTVGPQGGGIGFTGAW
jgi:hypothetical protein